MKRIGIDLDGTVADYMKGAVPLIAEQYGLTPDYKTDAYSIEEVFGLTEDNRPKDMTENLYINQHLFAKLPPLEEGNSQLTWNLKKYLGPDIKIYFVTARDNHPSVKEDTRQWLSNNTAYFDDIFHTKDKASFCKMSGIQVMIDDEVKQVTELLAAGIDVIMRDQPWNRHLNAEEHKAVNGAGRLTRVYNWKEMVLVAGEYYNIKIQE